MYNFGVLYELCKGVAPNYEKAREWYQKAADASNSDAKQALGDLRRKTSSHRQSLLAWLDSVTSSRAGRLP
jgi:TPR repeat protein